MTASANVTALAIIIGMLLLTKPYTNHISVPNVKRAYITTDIDPVSLVLMVFTAWGINDTVVQHAATIPVLMIQFMAS